MKYMVLMFGSAGEMMQVQSKDWITEMIGFMVSLNAELEASGDLLESRGLADEAKVVRLEDGAVVVSDGLYAEWNESFAG